MPSFPPYRAITITALKRGGKCIKWHAGAAVGWQPINSIHCLVSLERPESRAGKPSHRHSDRNSCENREGSQCCVVSSLCREIAKGRGLKSRGGRAGRIVNLNRKKCGGMARARGSAHGRNRNIRQVPRWRSRSAAERRNSKGIQTQFGDRAPLLQDAPSAGPS